MFFDANMYPDDPAPYGIVEDLGRAMNTLKNRPWKVTTKKTDIPKFFTFLHRAHVRFIHFVVAQTGMTAEDFFQAYQDKASLNHQRISGIA